MESKRQKKAIEERRRAIEEERKAIEEELETVRKRSDSLQQWVDDLQNVASMNRNYAKSVEEIRKKFEDISYVYDLYTGQLEDLHERYKKGLLTAKEYSEAVKRIRTHTGQARSGQRRRRRRWTN